MMLSGAARLKFGDDYHRVARSGDTVKDVADPRHHGRLRIERDGTGTVVWEETGWLSEGLSLRALRLVKRGKGRRRR